MCFGGFAPGMTSPSIAVVRKIRSPQTIGEEWHRPGIAVFHFTFSVGLHLVGRPVSGETPWLSGPRHCAHFAGIDFEGLAIEVESNAAAPKRPVINTTNVTNVFFIAFPGLFL